MRSSQKRKTGIGNSIGLFILSCMLVLLFQYLISNYIAMHGPEQTVSIKVEKLMVEKRLLRLQFTMKAASEMKKALIIGCCFVFIISYVGTFDLDREYVRTSVNIKRDMSSENAAADRFPSYKHCGWQMYEISIDPQIGEALADMFYNNSPDWIVLPQAGDLPEYVEGSRDCYYEKSYENDCWKLYHKTVG